MSNFFKGVWFTNWGPGIATSEADFTLENVIKPLSPNWIALSGPCWINYSDPSTLNCRHSRSVADDEYIHAVLKAHSLGLRVMMMPMGIDAPDGQWVAYGANYGSNESQWEAFFAAYTENLIHYAGIAEQVKADMLVIGAEQIMSQVRQKDWRAVAAAVREVYHGPLIYEAFGDTYRTVAWWDAVDYVGVNAYYNFSESDHDPTYDGIRSHWDHIIAGISDFSKRVDKPILITEIGWQSRDGVAKYGNAVRQPVRLDVGEQALLYQATIDSLKDQTWLKGIFFYNYSSVSTDGGMGNIDFTPHGKPAEQLLYQWYSGRPAAEPAPAPTDAPMKSSLWFFDDDWQNGAGVIFLQQEVSVVDDPLHQRGKSLRLSITDYNHGAYLGIPKSSTRQYPWLEFYMYSPKGEPNLMLQVLDGQWNPNLRTVSVRNFSIMSH
jgi:hypothetical protein